MQSSFFPSNRGLPFSPPILQRPQSSRLALFALLGNFQLLALLTACKYLFEKRRPEETLSAAPFSLMLFWVSL